MSVEDDSDSWESQRASHRRGSVSFLYQDVPGTVVDVFEAVWTQQNTSIPPRHDYHGITYVQNLWWETNTWYVWNECETERAGQETGSHLSTTHTHTSYQQMLCGGWISYVLDVVLWWRDTSLPQGRENKFLFDLSVSVSCARTFWANKSTEVQGLFIHVQ